jgi:hypothetical protein
VIESETADRNDVLITGTGRSGTTLTCHLLNKLPETVALHEPMRVKKLAELDSHAAVAEAVQRFCDEQRSSIREHGRAISKHLAGAVPDNPHTGDRNERGLRHRSAATKGEMVIDKELSPDFLLAVKHPAAFTAVLGELVKRFRVYAIVRNPLSTLASWSSIDFNARRGHVPAGERLDPALKAKLASIDEDFDRQLQVLHWFNDQFHRNLPQQSIIRYEALVESGGKALSVIQPLASELDEPLHSRNLNELYDRDSMLRMGERLLASEWAYWQSYSRESVESLLETQAPSAG